MQTCSSITTVPFPHTVQQLISNTSNGGKFHLLEQRLTGPCPLSAERSQEGAPQEVEAGVGSKCSSQAEAMETDAEAFKENTPEMPQLRSPLPMSCAEGSAQQSSARKQPAPCAPTPTMEPSTATKRRKTDRPQRRASSSDEQPKPSAAAAKHNHSTCQPAAGTNAAPQAAAAAVAAAAQAAAPQAEVSQHLAKITKRSSSPSVGVEAASNPPMSPCRAGGGQPVPARTPRSGSKTTSAATAAAGTAASKGQTAINRYFPIVPCGDGNSRESADPGSAQKALQPPNPQQQVPQFKQSLNFHSPSAHNASKQQQQHQHQQDGGWPIPQQHPCKQEHTPPSAYKQPVQLLYNHHQHHHQQLQGEPEVIRLDLDSQLEGVSFHDAAAGGTYGAAADQQVLVCAQQQQQQLDREEWEREKHQQQQQVALLQQREQELRAREAALTSELEAQCRAAADAQALAQELHQELSTTRSWQSEREAQVRSALLSLATELATTEASSSNLKLSIDSGRMGSLAFTRTGPMGFQEVWEDGQALRELGRQRAAVVAAREEVEAARKTLKKRLPPPPRGAGIAGANSSSGVVEGEGPGVNGSKGPGSGGGGSSSGSGEGYLPALEYVAQDEILKARLGALKREEEMLAKEEDRLQLERLRYIRSLKRLRDEEGSRFSGHPTLNNRYLLMRMLGKGGFSEVYCAYDVQQLQYSAVKIHQLNSTWSEAKKSSYVKHAIREYHIHKSLCHPNIVALRDIFEVDNNTFATVLEMCTGGDLDTHLKEHTTLPEREARVILHQIFSGLAYLNARHEGVGAPGTAATGRVIHYDLKPANILFDNMGRVKITDFGLSKVVEEGQTMGMELTSQGAGTYWYLPPECFQTSASHSSSSMASLMGRPGTGLFSRALSGAAGGPAAGVGPPGGAADAAVGGGGPVISNKVDVWSAGVIFYQMLYGRRPFGEGMGQEQILREGVMLQAKQVEFPSKPAVSAEAKAFIARCLAYRQEDRWDVMTAAADPYLQLRR